MEKLKEKYFSLANGYKEGWGWQIVAIITRSGTFHSKGRINLRDVRIQQRKFRDIHADRKREQDHEYYQLHKEEIKRNSYEYRKSHQEECGTALKKWQKNNPEKWHTITLRYNNKRRRNFGFIPLNESFDDSEAHHINIEYAIHIPKYLHRTISHNLYTGKNMYEINCIAWDFLKQQMGVTI